MSQPPQRSPSSSWSYNSGFVAEDVRANHAQRDTQDWCGQCEDWREMCEHEMPGPVCVQCDNDVVEEQYCERLCLQCITVDNETLARPTGREEVPDTQPYDDVMFDYEVSSQDSRCRLEVRSPDEPGAD
jgi:hypothetical protein